MKNFIFLIFLLSISFETFAQWVPQDSGYPTEAFLDCYFLDAQNGWVVGEKQLKTTDGGETWVDKSLIDPVPFLTFSVYFLDNSIGFLSGNHNIYKTTNGGNSWYRVHETLLYGHNIYSFDFIDSLKGWAAGGYFDFGNYLAYTSDGGENWTEISVPTDYLLTSIAFKDSLTGFAVGHNGIVVKTTNGGNTWIQTNFGDSFYFKKVQFISESTGWLLATSSSESMVFRTTNGGNSWHMNIIGNNNPGLSAVYFIDSQQGWAGGGPIFYTSNGGQNWEFVQYTPDIYSMFLVDRYHGWAVGNNGLILFSSNGGIPVELTSFTASVNENIVNLTWSTATELNNHGFEIERSSDKTVWATIGFKEGKGTTSEPQQYSYSDVVKDLTASKLYYKLRQIDFNGSFDYSDLIEVEFEIAPTSFALDQNFPNPFNPSTKISWQSPVGSWQTLKVYDVLGREVATLVDEYRDAGTYNVEFRIKNLPAGLADLELSSGIYFYWLKAGEYVETKKMLLLK